MLRFSPLLAGLICLAACGTDYDNEAWGGLDKRSPSDISFHVHNWGEECKHRNEASALLWQNCQTDHRTCNDYLEAFPHGVRRADMEPLVWQACQTSPQKQTECDTCCGVYIRQYPNGTHLEAAKKVERQLSEEAKAEREAESARQEAGRQEVFSGPKITADLELPSGAFTDNLIVDVQGYRAPVKSGSVTVPASSAVDLCYMNGSGFKTCATFRLGNGLNRVPLTYVTMLPVFETRCTIEADSSNSTTLEPGERGGLWVMIGEYEVSCQVFTTKPEADPASESAFTRSTSEPLRLSVRANERGGRADIILGSDGRSVSGRVSYTPFFPRSERP